MASAPFDFRIFPNSATLSPGQRQVNTPTGVQPSYPANPCCVSARVLRQLVKGHRVSFFSQRIMAMLDISFSFGF